ncbi:MAG: ribosome small subunit-dependent GTPase A [Planctomycetales bacterium]
MPAKKKRKLRVDFRKNRERRARLGDLTRRAIDSLEQPAGPDAFDTHEAVSGKGDLSRRRTVIGTDDGGGVVRDVDPSKCLRGRVLTARGLHALVRGEDGNRYECTVRRVLRTMSREERNAVVAGDVILFQPATEGQGVIERIEPRAGTLSRTSKGREHVIVANVDQVLVVASAGEPALKPNLIDRFLVSAAKGNARAVICVNKSDLSDPAGLEPVAGTYGRIGYEVVFASATQGAGIGRLRALLKNRQTVLAGQSGVGKSSLLNAIEPALELSVSAVSRWTQKGRHTTRAATLIELGSGGWVVDTPGIRQLDLWDVLPEEVEGHFVEFRPFVTLCRFPDCTHTHEAGCGVKQAVRRDLVSRMRYDSYVRMTEGE